MSQFNPGQAVFVVERDGDGAAVDVSGYMFLAVSSFAVICTSYIDDLEDLDNTLQYHIDETAQNYNTDLCVFPLEDCYSSLEDAQKAMQEGNP